MYKTSFSSKLYGHIFIPLKVIRVLLIKRNKRDEKEVSIKEYKVLTQLWEAYGLTKWEFKNWTGLLRAPI